MENEFPGNSRRERTAPQERKDESKNIEAVVTEGVVVRKKPVGKRFLETFLGDSAQNVVRHVLMDVLLPAAKDMVADAVSQGVERLIFGEARSASRRTGVRPGSGGAWTSYNRFNSGGSGPLPGRRDEPRSISHQARVEQNFDEIVLRTRVEATTVIERLYDLVDRYGMVTVGDLLSLVGATPKYTDENWGWTDLRGAKVERISDGYLLDLPRPEVLK